jgi:hypothetical protein
MDWQTIILIILIIGLLAWSVTRRRRPINDDLGIAVVLITDIDQNLKIVESTRNNYQSAKMFKNGAWKRYQGKLAFLGPSVISLLTETFTLIDDLNARIQSAKKSKTFTTLQDMPLDKASELLNKSRVELVTWLRSSDAAKAQNTRRGCMGS